MTDRLNRFHNRKNRAAAVILAAIVLVVMLFSVSALSHAVHHDCTGEDCPVCICIHQYESTLSQIDGAQVFAVLPILLFLFLLLNKKPAGVIFQLTLITEKIRLNI